MENLQKTNIILNFQDEIERLKIENQRLSITGENSNRKIDELKSQLKKQKVFFQTNLEQSMKEVQKVQSDKKLIKKNFEE